MRKGNKQNFFYRAWFFEFDQSLEIFFIIITMRFYWFWLFIKQSANDILSYFCLIQLGGDFKLRNCSCRLCRMPALWRRKESLVFVKVIKKRFIRFYCWLDQNSADSSDSRKSLSNFSEDKSHSSWKNS